MYRPVSLASSSLSPLPAPSPSPSLQEHEKLESAKAGRDKGRNLSELCEGYYKKYARQNNDEWPCSKYSQKDCILRDFLGSYDFSTSRIREVASRLGVNVRF